MTNEDIQQYFKDECSVYENVIKLGTKQLSREDYLQIKKLIEYRSGKWTGGKVCGFMFDSPKTAENVYASIINGDLENKKNTFQYFPTPNVIADRMVEQMNIRDNELVKVLEPSAGRGSLIEAVHRKFPNIIIDAYEINPDCFYALEQLWNVQIHKEDFLKNLDGEVYDYIIANPPFAKNADIKHFRKMYSVLKSHGTMCCIISSHALESSGREELEFKRWLYSLNPEIEELPSGTFKEAGTKVKTFMITVRK